MSTHDIRIIRILYMHILLSYFLQFMLLEWSGCPLNNPDSTRFSMIGIAVKYFSGARSIVLFYSSSYKHTETRKRASQSSLYYNTDALLLRYCGGTTVTNNYSSLNYNNVRHSENIYYYRNDRCYVHIHTQPGKEIM